MAEQEAEAAALATAQAAKMEEEVWYMSLSACAREDSVFHHEAAFRAAQTARTATAAATEATAAAASAAAKAVTAVATASAAATTLR